MKCKYNKNYNCYSFWLIYSFNNFFSLKKKSEEKCEQIETLKDEIDDVRKQFNKLRKENVELQQKAALANVYSDEIESLREKVS
jgi:CII-binding regulator of phage lambda lysogenization HflD